MKCLEIFDMSKAEKCKSAFQCLSLYNICSLISVTNETRKFLRRVFWDMQGSTNRSCANWFIAFLNFSLDDFSDVNSVARKVLCEENEEKIAEVSKDWKWKVTRWNKKLISWVLWEVASDWKVK